MNLTKIKEEKEIAMYETRLWTSSINVYKGPGVNHPVVGVLGCRSKLTIVKERGGQGAMKWGKLESEGGWIPLDYTDWVSSSRHFK